ncbi:MAG: hypothetical protein L6Q71_01845 [Planctomycetes bacterium]|nr:hypothetical protein [Planctomycetota bacterium]NUQ34379.1 hypothetical protein [Planctomycetaceae bacterium]
MAKQVKKRMGEALVEKGMITQDQLITALEYQKSVGGPLGQVLIKLGFITAVDLTNFLAELFSVPIVDLPAMILPIDLVKSIPWDLIKRHKILPIHQDGMTLTICTADPTDFDAIEEVQYATGKQVDLNLAPLPEITRTIMQLEARAKKARAPSAPSVPAQTANAKGGSTTNEDKMVEDVRTRSEGKLSSLNMTKAELREALILLLLKKGVITRAELYDAVAELLVKKGVLDAKDADKLKS